MQTTTDKPSVTGPSAVRADKAELASVTIPDPKWRDLYRIGAVASFLIGVFIIVAIAAFFIWPYKPGFTSVADIFATLHANQMQGIMSLDFFMVIITLITIPFYLGLFAVFQRVNASYSLLALVLGLISCVLILTVRPIAEMLSLSNQYAAATTDASRSQSVAAGEALAALFNGTAWLLYMVLQGTANLIYSVLMIRSAIFSKFTGYFGLIITVVGLGFWLPVVGMYVNLVTSLVSFLWYFLIAGTFFRLGWGKSQIPVA
jgi:Domain of unknown function (DUF4386)